MIKPKIINPHILKKFKKEWLSFIEFERMDYNCKGDSPDFPFLLKGRKGYDHLIVFMPDNLSSYLKIRISGKLYNKFKKGGIYVMPK